MSDELSELARLAESIHGKGTTVEMLNRWAAFESACKPELILSLIKDSSRWRAARNPIASGSPVGLWMEGTTVLLGVAADEAIDAAIAKGKKP